MISRLTRNFAGWLFWLGVVGGAMCLNVIMVLSNYLAVKVSFDLLGFDPQPLGADTLVGRLLGAFFAKATLAHFYAVAVAVTVAGGFFLVGHLLVDLIDLLEDRKAYLNLGDPESARVVAWRIICNLSLMVVLAIPLALAVHWDIQLFVFRSLAGASGIDDPAVAAGQVETLEQQLLKHGHKFAWNIARTGAWGYIAVTALAALGLEMAFHRMGQSWHRLVSPLDEWLEAVTPPAGQARFDGDDEYGPPVDDPYAPIAYDPDGPAAMEAAPDLPEPVAPMGPRDPMASAELTTTPLEARDDHSAGEASPGEPVAPSHHRSAPHQPAQRPLFDPAPALHPPGASATPGGSSAPRPESDHLREVIGGAEAERVSLATALADRERYHVDRATGQVWDRQVWEQLHA